ncbi:PDZ and LIM domain protein Zasp isoform X2 [Anthonomus grandis grandis]|uniref:PDZ and LIM domain protein Zasp isoform X2 n=1 Tax=Anthonomus grandis grandis TaxID=2921223 RepID=UPI002165A25F|nr:PDZ and LIM domain protein Zasp isoform X2 [Anthonomus grandis grandis]
MATLTTVRLSKGDSPSWGFRLQGGKDFGTPLVIQKVNGGSPAERAGLIAGDSVIRINNTDVFNLLHKEAQDVIVRAGNNFEMVIQRGGSTWKPAVVPVGAVNKPSPVPVQNFSPVTKTSLAALPGENIGAIGTGHNVSAKPFGQVNGAVNGGAPKLVNKQYNTPLKLYSEDAIAETISAQSEVLSTGALGVNFKKNEKNYDATNSAVYRMLKEAENEPTEPTNDSEPDSGIVSAPNKGVAGLRHVVAPQNKPAPAKPQIPPGQNICAECERLIVGVFVRIKDKNLHVECFKCSTCGSSLKNVGYYNINNKLYCDIHAKSAAIAINNPGVLGDVAPKPPANQISAALSSHLPASSPLSPKTSGYSPTFPSSNVGGPKPFSSVSAPLSPGGSLSRAAPISPGGSLHRAAPLSPQGNFSKPALSPTAHSYTSNSPLSSERHTNIIWPPPQEISDAPTACPLFYPPPSKVEAELEKKYAAKKQAEDFLDEPEDHNLDETMSFYSEEFSFSGRRSATECVEMLSETLDTQKFVENVIKATPNIAPPLLNVPEEKISTIECCQNPNSCVLQRPTQYNPNTVECQLQTKIENVVPQKWESPLTQSVRTTSPDADTFCLFQPKRAFSPLASALAVAPSEPFNTLSNAPPKPVPLPEFTEPYFPPEHPIIITKPDEKPEKVEPRLPPPKPYSPFVKALEIAPERPFTPIGSPSPKPPVKKKPLDPLDKLIDDLPKPSEKLDMRSALTTASDRPYTPLLPEHSDDSKNTKKNYDKVDRSLLTKPLKPEELPTSFQMNKKEPLPPSYYAPIAIEEAIQSEMEHRSEKSECKETKIIEKQTIEAPQMTKQIVQESCPMPSSFAPIFQGFSCSFKNKSDHAQFSVEVSTTPPVPCKPPTPISYIATVQEQPTRVTKETVIQETQGLQQTTRHQENVSVKVKQQQQLVQQQQEQAQGVVKAAQEVTQIKPIQTSQMLKKPEGLPSYQVNLKATAEADLLLMERKQRAEERLEQQKKQSQMNKQQSQRVPEVVSEPVCQRKVVPQLDTETVGQKPPSKPTITIQTEDVSHMATKLDFQPVPCNTFSSGSRSVTPSMVHRAPALLPYYQDNLVPHFHRPIETNVFDPTHPEVSRSPSPHPGKEVHSRSPSPFPQAAHQIRPKSPAEGPPPNPLRSTKPLPTPQDTKVQQAKESLKTYLPEYKDQRDIVEQQRGMDFYRKDSLLNIACPAVSVDQVQSQNVDLQIQQSRLEVDEKTSEVTRGVSGVARKDVAESMKQDHLAAVSKTASESTEKSADGSTQIHRRKLVTEEYEKSHKESNIEIRTSATYTNKDSFSKVNVPAIEPPTLTSFHVTNPHHVSFQKTNQPAPEPAQILVQPQLPPAQEGSESIPVPPPPPVRRVFPPGSLAPIKHVTPPSASAKPSDYVKKPNVPKTDIGAGAGRQTGGITAAPKRGKGLLNAAALPGARVPLCGHCHGQIRGPFITALGKIWCPNHFICATPSCKRPLQDLGFVEERGQLYCEYCFEQYLAPPCSKCNGKIKGDCLKAIGKNFHPECFNCVYCGKLFGNNPFFLEDGNPYCEADWNELFTTKCFACGFPVEAGDRWVEALNNNYHSQCFNCTMCKKNLEGQSFFAKGGRPFCKNHAR